MPSYYLLILLLSGGLIHDFMIYNIDDDDDEESEDKDAHIRNGETVPKLLEAPPLGQTLGLKRFIATEFCAVFCIAVLQYCRILHCKYLAGHWASNGSLQ